MKALQLTAVQLSGAISLPTLLAGYYLGANYSLFAGMSLIVIGNALLLTIALLYTYIGYHYQVITVELVEKFFGERGMVVCGISLLVLMVGWSVIQYHFIGLAVYRMTGIANLSVVIALASYGVIRHGLGVFAFINKILIPCLLVVLYLAVGQIGAPVDTSLLHVNAAFSLGIILVITTAAGMVFDCPTFYRDADSALSMRISLMLLFGLVVPAMEFVGLFLAKNNALIINGNSLAAIFQQFNLIGLIFLSLSSFLSNCLNVYSATLVTMHFTKTSYSKTLLWVCMVPAGISLLNISDSLVLFLEVINGLAVIILIMVVTQRLFNGFNLNVITDIERRRHEHLLYIIIMFTLMLQCVPVLKQFGLFVTTCLSAALVMSSYYQTRKLICNN